MDHPRPSTRRVGSRLASALVIVSLAVAGVALIMAGTVPGGSVAAIRPAPTVTASGAPAATSRTVEPAASSPAVLPALPGQAPTTAPTRSPALEPSPALDPPPREGPFEIDLYEKGDFVSEASKIWCVPAAMQTMINIMSPGADEATATQKRYYALARKLSPPTLEGAGAEPGGWAAALDRLGYGPYAVAVEPTRVAAIHAAATALRMTGRPVGLLVWRGAHAWVMSGFRATADPARTDDFTVTHVFIEDVWYPRVSSIWGRSRPPDALVPVGLLPEDYLRWKRPTGPYPGKDGKFVLIIPIAGATDG